MNQHAPSHNAPATKGARIETAILAQLQTGPKSSTRMARQIGIARRGLFVHLRKLAADGVVIYGAGGWQIEP